jgi:hypothetical protein
MVDSIFREALIFLNQLGLYDVILPFLLVFTIVFAILEKTKIFGLGQDADGNETTKKNLNAMFAFVSAFLVIASTKLVSVINEAVANIVLLLILAICFMLLVGSFHSGKEEFNLKDSPWLKFFMFFMFIGIILIFLNALDWLSALIQWIEIIDKDWVISAVFLLITAGFVFLIVGGTGSSKSKKKD